MQHIEREELISSEDEALNIYTSFSVCLYYIVGSVIPLTSVVFQNQSKSDVANSRSQRLFEWEELASTDEELASTVRDTFNAVAVPR